MGADTAKVVVLRVVLLAGFLAAWQVLTATDILPPFVFGQPVQVFAQIYEWFASGMIFLHLGVTVLETLLSFAIGTASGLVVGLWLGLSPFAARVADPFIKGFNAMPRVILGPIFAVWFGLGIWSKVWLGVTIVFFLVFFNVFQGVREVSPVILANARLLGANRRQLLRMVYIPSAMTWVFASLHNAVGLAFVGAVVGEYLGSSRGVGYLILQAEGMFNMNAVFAGIIVLTGCAFVLDQIVAIVERRLLIWQQR
ncbi:MAG TPA: ABC transporter permease [Rhodopila sp.]|nr:ABC transporter permease [Rhodopila sp.]